MGAAARGGETIADVGDRFDADQLGDDPLGAWQRATAEVRETAEEPGALDRTVSLSYGDVPARDYIAEVAVDTVIHT